MGTKQLVPLALLLAAAGLHAADAPATADTSAPATGPAAGAPATAGAPKVPPQMSSEMQRAAADSTPGAPAPGTPEALEAANNARAPQPVQQAGAQAPLAPLEWRLMVQSGRIRTLVNVPGAADAGFDFFRYGDATMVRYFNADHDPTHEDGFSILPHENYRPQLLADAVGPSQALAERSGAGWSVSYLNQENRVKVAYAQELPEGMAPPPEPANYPEVVTPLIASVSIVRGPMTVTYLPWASRPGDFFVIRAMPRAVSVLHADGQGGLSLQEVVEKPALTEAAVKKVKALVKKTDEPATPLFAMAIRAFNGWNISYVGSDGQAKTVYAADAVKPPEVVHDASTVEVEEDPDLTRRYWLAGISFSLMAVAGGIAWFVYRRAKKARTKSGGKPPAKGSAPA